MNESEKQVAETLEKRGFTVLRNEVMLRKMELHDIFQISGWGKVAKREVGRWSREHLNKVVEGD